MKDAHKTKKQLVKEGVELRQRINELEASEAEWKQAEDRILQLASFPELNPDPIIEVDNAGKISYLNTAARKLLVNPVKTGTEHPILRSLMSTVLTLECQQGGSLIIETEYGERVFEQRVSCFSKKGSIRSYIKDITERQQAKEELTRLASFPQLNPNPIIECDLNGTVTYVNSATLEEFPDLPSLGLKHPIVAAVKITATSLVGTGDKSLVVNTPVGQRIYEQQISYVSESRRMRSYVQDVTERKKMEEQLIRSDRLASIGELVSGVAHELNNPMTSIIGFSELLLDQDISDNVRKDLETINKEATRTAEIIKGLLTFARKQPIEKRPVEINKVIQAVLDLRAYEFKLNNIEVDTHFAPDLPKIIANGSQLQQVFLNLVVNSEQAMLEAHNKGILTITSEQVGDIVKVSFADDGPGIAQENLGQVFDPFFTTKEQGKGTGLGLSISYGIIADHRGLINVESKVGRGATFVIELPIDE